LEQRPKELKTFKKKPIPAPVISLQKTYQKLSTIQSALNDLAEYLGISEQSERQKALMSCARRSAQFSNFHTLCTLGGPHPRHLTGFAF
jgi:hypothetical protein